MREPIFLDDPHRPAVRVVRQIAQPIDGVWAGLTAGEHLRHWFPGGAAIEPRASGEVHFGENGEGGTGEVLEYDPPRRLAYTWEDDRLSFELEPDAGGTLLTVTHDFDDRAGAASFAAGWEHGLEALASDLAGHPVPVADHDAVRHEQLVAELGLDRPLVVRDAAGWHVRFERQLTGSFETAWNAFLGTDPASAAQRKAPGVGGELRAADGFDGPLGTVTEIDPPHLLILATTTGVPGDRVELRLIAGTDHGARMVLDVHGADEAEFDAAMGTWGGEVVAGVAAECARRAG